MAKRHNGFTRFGSLGKGSVYTCDVCKRRTRDTGDNGGTHLCSQCYELAGIENALSDYGPADARQYTAAANAAFAVLVKKGADTSSWTELLATLNDDAAPHRPHCPCPECFGGDEHTTDAGQDDVSEDYPGQHVAGPDHDTRDREGADAPFDSADSPLREQRGELLPVSVTVSGPSYANTFTVPLDLDPKGGEFRAWCRTVRTAIAHAQQLRAALAAGSVADIQRGDDPRDDHAKIETARERRKTIGTFTVGKPLMSAAAAKALMSAKPAPRTQEEADAIVAAADAAAPVSGKTKTARARARAGEFTAAAAQPETATPEEWAARDLTTAQVRERIASANRRTSRYRSMGNEALEGIAHAELTLMRAELARREAGGRR